MSTRAATWSAWFWWQVRLSLRMAMLRVLLGLVAHALRCQQCNPLRRRLARLALLARWRREWREGLRAFERALVEHGGRAAPSVAEIRARTADLVPYESRRKPAKHQRKPEAGA